MRILKKAVTLIDIAKACDTSNVTVSKALAGKSGVSDALREKIKQVADRMGYVGVKSTQNREAILSVCLSHQNSLILTVHFIGHCITLL